MNNSTDQYVVGGAGLPQTATDRPFEQSYDPRGFQAVRPVSDHHERILFEQSYDPRGFQAAAFDWIAEEPRQPVAVLAAPTGAGKTDVITALGKNVDKLLAIYPTNALIDAQATAIEDAGLSTTVVTGGTLSGRGSDRSDQLLRIAQQHHQDVLVTNPDVLQAIIQNLYFSPGSRILQFYAQFDAAVFDEFHYYDPLAASGLLTQIKVLSERGAFRTTEGKRLPRFLLSSATPAKSFLEYVRDDLKLDLRNIRSTVYPLDVATASSAPDPISALVYDSAMAASQTAQETTTRLQSADDVEDSFGEGIQEEPPDGISRFRLPMCLRRHEDWIGDAFDDVAERVAETISTVYEGGPPVGAVIFNSAGLSNDFQAYLSAERPDIVDLVTKDNGYDTNAGREVPAETAVLNTTSKGEVGLDYDLAHLIMARPFTADQFIQRIGRAARRSPATVDLYGMSDPTWPRVQSYPEFLQRVTDTFVDVDAHYERLRQLTGLRAALAIHDREQDEQYHADAYQADFTGFPAVQKWRGFFSNFEEATSLKDTDGWTSPTLSARTVDLLAVLKQVKKGLRSLRGRTLQHPVIYPRGGDTERTEYDIISALSHYVIETVDPDVIRLSDHRSPERLRGYYPGAPRGGDGIDLLQSRYKVSERLEAGYLDIVSAADFGDIPLAPASVRSLIELVPLFDTVLPATIRTSEFELQTQEDRDTIGEVSRL